jgi:hypothetical protein
VQPWQPTEPAAQVIHTVRVTIIDAELFRDPHEFVELRFDPNLASEEDREKRFQKVERTMESYVKVIFGSSNERHATKMKTNFLKRNAGKLFGTRSVFFPGKTTNAGHEGLKMYDK